MLLIYPLSILCWPILINMGSSVASQELWLTLALVLPRWGFFCSFKPLYKFQHFINFTTLPILIDIRLRHCAVNALYGKCHDWDWHDWVLLQNLPKGRQFHWGFHQPSSKCMKTVAKLVDEGKVSIINACIHIMLLHWWFKILLWSYFIMLSS